MLFHVTVYHDDRPPRRGSFYDWAGAFGFATTHLDNGCWCAEIERESQNGHKRIVWDLRADQLQPPGYLAEVG